MTQPAQWFRDEIFNGLARLLVLRLPSAPWEEEAEYTQQTWIEVLWAAPIGWDQERDTQRIRAAFNRLAAGADRWPAPRQMLELLPERAQQRRLPKPPMSQAKREQNRARLREMMAELGIQSTRGDRNA
ncbi:hypothetical protein [Billgrantia ethanolica]|uniref:Uncharacterized protein n=1 Tax=Billgrantia ethanolica TaxID=2733486 RepID=A0ABS9A894_9GAMM|nr:hypothetical protein [Halomonas ethanolica]MCE8004245.1 hypothetical protein [Halomonas ethanolica]